MPDPSVASLASPEFLTAINSLRSDVFYALFFGAIAITILIVSLRFIERLLDRSTAAKLAHEETAAKIREEEAKSARAKTYQSALKGLSDSINKQTQQTEAINARSTEMLSRFGGSLNAMTATLTRVERVVEHVLSKQDGQMPRQQCIEFAEAIFRTGVTERCIGIVHYWMIENDYIKRSDFIRESILTEIGQHLSETREFMRRIPMVVRADTFFTVTPTSGTERFLLADEVWLAVAPFFKSDDDLTARIEAMRLRVLNRVKDHIDTLKADMATSDIHLRALSRKNVTPRPTNSEKAQSVA